MKIPRSLNALSRRRLEWLVRARGTDLSTWPQADRLAALALLRQSPEAQLAFADALVDEEPPEGDRAVVERMQAVLRRRLAPLSLLMRGLWAGALVSCVVTGLYLASAQELSAIQADADADPFTSAQTISLAALDQ